MYLISHRVPFSFAGGSKACVAGVYYVCTVYLSIALWKDYMETYHDIFVAFNVT